MNKQQATEYLENYTFKLKDYNKTNDKYKDYKNEKFSKILEEIKEYPRMYTLFLSDNVEYNLHNNYYFMDIITKDIEEEKSKSSVRRLATYINTVTRNELASIVERASDELEMQLNDNEKRCFTIKLYIALYDDINEEMKEILQSLALSYMWYDE